MNSTVELPIWAVLLLLALAVIWLLQHLLLPSIRWFFRYRANRVIDEVNNRLALKIPSFKWSISLPPSVAFLAPH